ncbi:rod shape determining protein RodA [Dyadobacter sp. BE34]|uniref:Cell wall polymerase n=1 Tax=Dyadobacter fermentans TaxID=94254 RepID=A0ABU1R5R4_9BACT|nr:MULTISPECIES: rod shape-determining protein RodA [Dyadobacter]MDR6808746.1 rod shape determining protein RodA [Dyadobacter fermentans]MDR7046489.1 rod shape determining protein RodA [Dyadobacter sp. BE242]MDR7200802.1 rod shape determining protein RodA [Dyadobacter sp. BE34]MDR7218762.1 rod shape determining protein RodA [Dyadobacter sp. BE31]MDR7266692.1 rod shape determining protein RodA [Dyadobacter sp. BE32]
MAESKPITKNVDWMVVLIYIACLMIGWLNIYAAVYNPEAHTNMFDLSNNAGKQLMWIGTAALLIICILVIDYKFYETFSFVIYAVVIFLLVVVLFAGSNINGSRSWIKLGGFSLQPAEFSKLAVSLAISKYLSDPAISLNRKLKDYYPIMGIIALPAFLILLSNETGSMLVFASFAIVLYREGMPGFIPAIGMIGAALLIITLLFVKWYIAGAIIVIAGLVIWLMPVMTRRRGGLWATIIVALVMIGIVFGVDFFMNNVLQKHQRGRIMVLLDPDSDPRGIGWNVIQSKIAIGSGGLWGKGFLQGTQTKFDFVPEQSTDFIFCTVGEEHGFVGTTIVVFLFVALISRLVVLAERQRSRFARVYGYCVAGIIFFHFLVNVGMTIGLMPVIGIPLPFFSYGGSSLWSFSVLLFIFLKIDAQRPFTLSRG